MDSDGRLSTGDLEQQESGTGMSPAMAALVKENRELRTQLDALAESQVSLAEHNKVKSELAAKEKAYDELHGKYRHLQDVLRKATEHLEGKLEGEKRMRLKDEVKHKLQTKTLQDLTEKYLAEVEARRDADYRAQEAEAAADARIEEIAAELRKAKAHNTDLNLMYLQCKMVKEDLQASYNQLKSRVQAARRRRTSSTHASSHGSCKNATRYFCFVHHAHVCSDCVASHSNCVCGLYIEWLNDSDYQWPPTCPICAQLLAKGETLRLLCYHMVHPHCLRDSLASLPDTTAPHGYACPVDGCGECVVPHLDDNSRTAANIRGTLATQPWYARVAPLVNAHGSLEATSVSTTSLHSIPPASSPLPAASDPVVAGHRLASPSPSASSPARASPAVLPRSGFVGVLGSSARKPALDFTEALASEDAPGLAHDGARADADAGSAKYRKRSLWRSLSAWLPYASQLEAYFTSDAGLPLPGSAPRPRRAGFPLWALYVFVAVVVVIVVVVSLASREPPTSRARRAIASG
ncbi:uncharacterized protein AMSG_02951 [Thecamonas trahens ATCC 50062]|uniref:RING-type domain-containing protein n=1 Tax=Thecamonas trahens ATCC 50062 TaxID=461836 RepID=A0A0L0D2V9_THETB|nr:hypothetical protein AMSG_02951 [Thecamonas trahens ATCC 50062]KNC46515.1 hypothetical protein AMSG_02951 [Thecamonas trahens ATCC 50062]|eukprot:XP_013760296.1 hypothetical protein AMSG_02951 [Thecamonas trahens ATCC 50062]